VNEPNGKVGRLRHQLVLQSASTSYNALRQPVQSWSSVSNHRAEVRPANGREVLTAQQLGVQVSHLIVVRHPGRGQEFSPETRLVDRLTEDVFNVTHTIDPDDRGQFLHVYATHRASPREQVDL
jgi:SPP1 family predicted phage head-tail adaptor